jgi:hypothetical protein
MISFAVLSVAAGPAKMGCGHTTTAAHDSHIFKYEGAK